MIFQFYFGADLSYLNQIMDTEVFINTMAKEETRTGYSKIMGLTLSGFGCGIIREEGFPGCNVCKGEWKNFGRIINRAIAAIKKVSESSKIKSRIILHVADPKNIEWWFDNVAAKGDVHDFDIIGF